MASPWIHIALLVPLSALAGAALLCHRSPDLSEVKTTAGVKEAMLHDLASVLEQTAIKQSGPIDISESELNDYLQRTVRVVPSGISGYAGRLDRVLIDLEEDRARLHLCWVVFGHPTIATVDFAVRRTTRDFTIEVMGGAYGQLEVGRGLLLPLTPALQTLANACKPEIEALFKLPNIHLAKDKIHLDTQF